MTVAASTATIVNEVRKGPITVTVMLASTIYALDWTIASVALPHMQGTFSVTQEQVSWVITSYIVLSAIMLPATSWLAVRFGRRNLFIAAVSGFTVFSALCGGAESLATEIIYRIGQGASGAFLIPLSQAIMLDTYPREQHAKAMALWGMGVMLGPILGPVVGGYLTEFYSWRWVFYINLPLGAVAVIGALMFMPRTPPDAHAPAFDWQGFLFLGSAIGALQMMLDRGERLDWFESNETVMEAGLVLLGAYLFIVHSFTRPNPLVNLRLMADRNYALGLIFVFLYGLLTLAPMVLLPPFLQGLQGYPILDVGVLLAPRGLGIMMAMMFFGKVGERIDPRASVFLGFSLLSISSLMMAQWTLEVTTGQVAWTGFLQGVGAGAIVMPLSILTFATLDLRHRTEASSIWNLTRSVGSSIGIAVALIVLVRMTSTSRAVLAENVTPFSPGGGFSGFFSAQAGAPRFALLEGEMMRQAAMIGYIDVFYASAMASLVVLPLVVFLRRPAAPPAAAGKT